MREKALKLYDLASKHFYASYTALFIVLFCCFWFGYAIHYKGFIWGIDGLEQQYPFFVLEGEWLRSLLTNIFITHTFEIPMWSADVGYGADYFVSISNSVGNPINLLSVFADAQSADLVLNATVPITLYLAGLSFIGYCRYRQASRAASIIGSFIYIFGGYSFITFTQIYLLYPLVLAPFVLYGVDRVVDNRGIIPFAIAMALVFACGVTTAFATCLLLAVYGIVRFIAFDSHDRTMRTFLHCFVRIAAGVLLGFLVGSVFFLPVAANILGQGRIGLERYSSLTYSLAYYVSVFGGFVSGAGVGEDCQYGFVPIALIAVVALFLRSGKSESNTRKTFVLRAMFVLLTIFLLVPAIGRIFNGFAYPNNRWVWAYCLLVSLISVNYFERLEMSSKQDRRRIVYIAFLYAFIAGVICISFESYSLLFALALLMVVIIVIEMYRNNRRKLYIGFTAIIAVFCLFISYNAFLSSDHWEVGLGRSYRNSVSNTVTQAVKNVSGADQNVKFDSTGSNIFRNSNIQAGLKGTSFYNSFYNSYVDQYHTELGLCSSTMNFSYNGFNARDAMEAMAGITLFATPTGHRDWAPSTFSMATSSSDDTGAQYDLYRPQHQMSLATVCDAQIARATYQALDPIQKQDAFMQGVVLDNPTGHVITPKSRSSQCSYSIDGIGQIQIDASANNQDSYSLPNGISISGNTIRVTQPETKLHVRANVKKGDTAYLYINNMQAETRSSEDTAKANDTWRLMDPMQKFITRNASGSNDTKLFIDVNGKTTEIWQTNSKSHLNGGKNTWIANLGPTQSDTKEFDIEFRDAGTFTFSSIQVLDENTRAVSNDIASLSKKSASNISYEGNTLSCSAEARDGSQTLLVRLPYSSGWSATVNGHPVTISRADTAFMSIPLDSGNNDIRFMFETPYLKLGCALSGIGIAICIALALIGCQKHKKRDASLQHATHAKRR